MDFIALDFEIANNSFDSACSLGMVFVEKNTIIDEKYFLIKPPTDHFDPSMTAIHKIPEKQLLGSPTFDKIWLEIEPFFNEETIIIAHNAQFDMNVLRHCLNRFQLPTPDFYYACSIPICNRAIKNNKTSSSLEEVTKYFGIDMSMHHHALSDARACAESVLASIQQTKTSSLAHFLQKHPDVKVRLIHEHKLQDTFYVRKSFENVKMSEIKLNKNPENKSHPFYDKTVVFTGNLEGIDRKTAMQKVANLGGIPRSSVSRKTNYVVVGKQDLNLVGPTGKSSKQRKAEELINSGYDLKIIDENQFIQLLDK